MSKLKNIFYIKKNKSSVSKSVDAKKSFLNHKFYLVFIIVVAILIITLLIFIYFNSKTDINTNTNNNTNKSTISDLNETSMNESFKLNNLPKKDCDTDLDCFMKSANICELVKLDYNFEVDSRMKDVMNLGDVDKNKMFTVYQTIEVHGKELNKCIIHNFLNSAEITYSDAYVESLLADGKSMEEIYAEIKIINDGNISKGVGIGNICKIDLNNLTTVLNNFKINYKLSIDASSCIPTKDGVPINTP